MLALALLACDGDRPAPPEPTGATGDTGSPLPEDRLFDGRVLVVPDTEGVRLRLADGTDAAVFAWRDLLGECQGCTGEGASADGDGLLVSWASGFGAGGIARIDPRGTLDFRVDGFGFPHDALRDPADGAIMVPEASLDRISWIAGDGSSSDRIRALDLETPGYAEEVPNGIELVEHAGRTYLLSSNRGPASGEGRIVLWDITDPAAPALQWKFPAGEGRLDTPHGPVLRPWEGRLWLLWAHTAGAPDGTGTVGLAVTDDPSVAPTYVADLLPSGAEAPYGFLRGVELTADGTLLLTDTGDLTGPIGIGGATGRILATTMPTGLAPTGASGAVGTDQVFVDLPAGELLRDGLGSPFEGWLWTPTISL